MNQAVTKTYAIPDTLEMNKVYLFKATETSVTGGTINYELYSPTNVIPLTNNGEFSVPATGNNYSVRVSVSTSNKAVTPVNDDINVNVVDGGLYSANGSITGKDFTVTEKNEKLIVEIHGRKNSGTFNAELKIGNLVPMVTRMDRQPTHHF